MSGVHTSSRARSAKVVSKKQVATKSAKPPISNAEPTKGLATDPRPGRRLKPRRYKSLQLKKRIKHPVHLPSSWKIAKQARQLLYRHWRLIGAIVLTYGIINFVLVHGINGGLDVRELKSQFSTLFKSNLGHLAAGLSVFALLVSSSNTTSGASGATAYQSLLFLVVSLALIWTFRQLLAGNKVRMRDAYYKGMYPIIPVILVLMVISLQLIPLITGAWLYATVTQYGIAITGLEKSLWLGLFLLLALLSIYMICSSIFAVYIATLADMTPMKALRSARELVRYRRWTVLRKVLFLPLWLLVVGSLIMLPIISFAAIAAQWIFTLLAMIAIAVGHAYMYTLYRELLREKP